MRLIAFARVLCGLGLFVAGHAVAGEVLLIVEPGQPTVDFALQEIAAALKERGDTAVRMETSSRVPANGRAQITLLGTSNAAALESLAEAGVQVSTPMRNEGFSVHRSDRNNVPVIWVFGSGPGGVMYGGLEVAEQIRLHGLAGVEPMQRNPYMAMRGTKFNLPLDVRTPSYTDAGDSAQQNIATVWDYDFWTAYLDQLARHRYNYVSLWNLHPFPSLVKVPAYPDVALADIQRSTGTWAEHYSTRAEDLTTPAILDHVETLKRITIEEKIEFWRRVMRYAKDRNIDFYIVTWNTYTGGLRGKYGITDDLENPVTIDYFRQSVRELFATYPLLAGIGVTAGENMGAANSSFEAKENWLMATYGQGVLDAAKDRPGRKIRFIHRQHETKAQDIARTFAPLVGHPDIYFVFSFKYAQAHALSSTTQTFHKDFVASLGSLKTLWTLRNDDALMFRWGAPDFVRDFIRGIPMEPTQGIYYGSDMWVWGREFLSLGAKGPRRLEVEKHWYHWMLWGRLAYDPTLGDERFVEILAQRFPGAEAPVLFDAWQQSSLIYPLTTGFHWGQYDFQWYIEACQSRPGPAQTESGFHDVNRFITLGVHPGTDNISIPLYVEDVVAGRPSRPGTVPPQVAEKLHQCADAVLAGLAKLSAGSDRELQETLADIRAMALLGKYYAHKIQGATQLALFRKTGRAGYQEVAIAELTKAQEFWGQYTTLAASLYRNPMWTNRVGTVDWTKLRAEVAKDITIAQEAKGP